MPGAWLSLKCLFYWSTDHIWKSLGRLRSPLALMRARAREAAASPAPRVLLVPFPPWEGNFSRARSCHHPLFLLFPPLNPWQVSIPKSCPSHPSPKVKPSTDPAAPRDGSKGKFQLLVLGTAGLGGQGWICDVPCGAGGLQPHAEVTEHPKEHAGICAAGAAQPEEQEMGTVRQPRASHLTLGQVLIRICTSIEPQK